MSKPITIAGVNFVLTAPYAAGQSINEAEASALNQVRAENIGNNCRKAINDAKVEGVISDAAKAVLNTLVAQKDAEYVFTMASAGVSKVIRTPVEKEARALAKAKLIQMLDAAGKTLKEYGKEAADAKIEEIAGLEAVIKLATKNVHNRAALASDISL